MSQQCVHLRQNMRGFRDVGFRHAVPASDTVCVSGVEEEWQQRHGHQSTQMQQQGLGVFSCLAVGGLKRYESQWGGDSGRG